MVKPRVVETDQGITGEFNTQAYDQMMRSGLVTSINASYVLPEIKEVLARTSLPGWQARQNLLGLVISGQKPA